MANIIDTLIGDSSLRRQRDQAIDYARDLYDPSSFNPMLSEQRSRATEGLGDAGDIARSRTVQSLFSPTTTMTQTGNQGRALALQGQQQQGRQQALSQFESMLAERDIQTRQQAERQFAQTRTRQLQTADQRDAAEEQAQLQYEAEKSRRKQALGGAALGLVGTLATTPFGAAGTSLVGRGLGSIFGEDENGQREIQWTSEAMQAFGDQTRSNVSVDSIFGQQEQPTARDVSTLMSQDWQQQGSVTPTQQSMRDSQDGGGRELFDSTIPSREGIMTEVPEQESGVSVGGSSEPQQQTGQFGLLGDYARQVFTGEEIDQDLFGERVYSPVRTGIENVFGSAFGKMADVGTFPARSAMNVGDLSYRAGTQEYTQSSNTNNSQNIDFSQVREVNDIQNIFDSPETPSRPSNLPTQTEPRISQGFNERGQLVDSLYQPQQDSIDFSGIDEARNIQTLFNPQPESPQRPTSPNEQLEPFIEEPNIPSFETNFDDRLEQPRNMNQSAVSDRVDTTIQKGQLDLPVEGEITKDFGIQTNPEFGTETPNLGINIKTSEGSPIKSVGNGIVKNVQFVQGHGTVVVVDHNGTLVAYGNVENPNLSAGDTVMKGNPIGSAGKDDVFFSVREGGQMVDPISWIKR